MDRDNRSWPMRVVAGIWRGLDRLRRLLHLILLLGLFLLLLIGVVGERVLVPDSAALVIAPQGSLVDQLSGDALERAIAKAQGTPRQETLVRDVIDGLRAARDDERIKAVVLDLDGLTGAGLSKLQEIARELARFKQSGKRVIAVGRWLHARSVLPRGPGRRRLHASHGSRARRRLQPVPAVLQIAARQSLRGLQRLDGRRVQVVRRADHA